MDISFLAMEDTWLAVNKPAGLRTIPDGYDPNLPYLSGILNEQMGKVWVVHRLDKDTSGVILFARTLEAHKAITEQFAQRETRKIYHAIVIGMPEWEEISISLPLRTNGDRRHRTVVDHQRGKAAETEARVLRRLGVFTLLEAQPHSGYTHQIRAHLSATGFPLLGDPLYQSLQPETQATTEAAEMAPNLPIQRTALHAYQITFAHPVTGQPVTVQAPYPDDFRETLDQLISQQPTGQ